MDQKKKTSHKKRNIVLGILCGILVAILAVGFWQKNNIKAAWILINQGDQSIGEMQEEQVEKRQELLDELGLGDQADLITGTQNQTTGEGNTVDPAGENGTQGQTGTSGTTSQGGTTGGSDTGTSGGTSTGTSDGTSTGTGSNSGQSEGQVDEVKVALQKLYQIESEYQAKISGVAQATKEEFRALPKEEQTSAKKQELVRQKVSELSNMEKQCDAEVEGQLTNIQQALQAQGKDTAVVKEIRALYEDNKAIYKASLLAEFSNTN